MNDERQCLYIKAENYINFGNSFPLKMPVKNFQISYSVIKYYFCKKYQKWNRICMYPFSYVTIFRWDLLLVGEYIF
jgi:hypothetical protein